MFGDLKFAVRNRELSVQSEATVRECTQYVRLEGKIVHATSRRTADDSSKGSAHGDRVIALCIAYQAAKDRPVTTIFDDVVESNGEPPRGTIAHRYWEHMHRGKLTSEWDARGSYEMRRGRG